MLLLMGLGWIDLIGVVSAEGSSSRGPLITCISQVRGLELKSFERMELSG